MKKTRLFMILAIAGLMLAACNPPDYSRFSQLPKPEAGNFRILTPDQTRYRVDVITIEPGAEIYSAWGHSAMRIMDKQTKQDLIFDYGLFLIDNRFIKRFLNGEPAFKVDAFHYYDYLRHYRNDNRRIFSQQLLISDQKAQMLLEALLLNIAPQNNTFLYHHFHDNCTTRIRDRINDALDGRYSAHFSKNKLDSNFRMHTTRILAGRPFLWLGTNLVQGAAADQRMDAWQNQFLPMDLMIALDEYRSSTNDAKTGPIQIVLEPGNGGFKIDRSTWILPGLLLAFIIIVFFVLPIWFSEHSLLKYAWRFSWVSWNLVAGFTGWILLLGWLFTNHDTLYNNINILGFSPLLWPGLIFSLYLRYSKNLNLLKLWHQFLIAPPLIGLLASITGIIDQFTWPFLGLALVIQILQYIYFTKKTVEV